MHCRPRRSQQLLIQCAAATDSAQSGDMKTVVQKMTPGDVPFPWSEKDPFRLPVSIDRVQKMLITLGECASQADPACADSAGFSHVMGEQQYGGGGGD